MEAQQSALMSLTFSRDIHHVIDRSFFLRIEYLISRLFTLD